MKQTIRFFKYLLLDTTHSILYWIILFVLTDIFHIWYMFSAVITAALLTMYSFPISKLWIWKKKEQNSPKNLKQELKDTIEILKMWKTPVAMVKFAFNVKFVRFVLVGILGTLLGWSLLYVLTEYGHLWYMVSSIIGTLIVIILKYIANEFWTWREKCQNAII